MPTRAVLRVRVGEVNKLAVNVLAGVIATAPGRARCLPKPSTLFMSPLIEAPRPESAHAAL